MLDELESIGAPHSPGDRKTYEQRRAELLSRALYASRRGVQALMDEPWVQNPNELLGGTPGWYPIDTALRLAEELRQDDALLRAFVTAECRLMSDLGVDVSAVERLRGMLTYVLLEAPSFGEPACPQMRELLDKLEHEIREATDRPGCRRLGIPAPRKLSEPINFYSEPDSTSAASRSPGRRGPCRERACAQAPAYC